MSGETWKENEVPVGYNGTRFDSLATKLRFDENAKINKNFIVERGMKFELKQKNHHFEGITNKIMALVLKRFVKNQDATIIQLFKNSMQIFLMLLIIRQ